MKLRYLSPKLLFNSPRLTKEAERRLSWMDWYEGHGRNARKTCRYFGISPDTFYRWKRVFKPRDLTSLEDDKETRRPHRIREMTTPKEVIDKIIEIRRKDMEKSKYEIQEELRRQEMKCTPTLVQKN